VGELVQGAEKELYLLTKEQKKRPQRGRVGSKISFLKYAGSGGETERYQCARGLGEGVASHVSNPTFGKGFMSEKKYFPGSSDSRVHWCPTLRSMEATNSRRKLIISGERGEHFFSEI